jgi:enterochelin esterase-like enzyme
VGLPARREDGSERTGDLIWRRALERHSVHLTRSYRVGNMRENSHPSVTAICELPPRREATCSSYFR